MKRPIKSIILVIALLLPLILQSENKAQAAVEAASVAGPFGKCGDLRIGLEAESDEIHFYCVYHLFKCECVR